MPPFAEPAHEPVVAVEPLVVAGLNELIVRYVVLGRHGRHLRLEVELLLRSVDAVHSPHVRLRHHLKLVVRHQLLKLLLRVVYKLPSYHMVVRQACSGNHWHVHLRLPHVMVLHLRRRLNDFRRHVLLVLHESRRGHVIGRNVAYRLTEERFVHQVAVGQLVALIQTRALLGHQRLLYMVLPRNRRRVFELGYIRSYLNIGEWGQNWLLTKTL